jgi:hypothetical protein
MTRQFGRVDIINYLQSRSDLAWYLFSYPVCLIKSVRMGQRSETGIYHNLPYLVVDFHPSPYRYSLHRFQMCLDDATQKKSLSVT